MRINPDVELCAEGFADLRHIQHADWGAVQVADSAGDVVAMVLVLSGCLVGLAVGAVLCVWAVVLHRGGAVSSAEPNAKAGPRRCR